MSDMIELDTYLKTHGERSKTPTNVTRSVVLNESWFAYTWETNEYQTS